VNQVKGNTVQIGVRAAVLCSAGLVLVVVASRFAFLAADPPYWIPDAFLFDSGWWANGARGKLLFGDYFAEDFGMGYLVTPAYTWALQAVYALWGVGLVQAQVFDALCNTLVVVLTAIVAWRCAGATQAIVTAALLGISPYFWGYGRVALPESPQLLLIVGAFALWFEPSVQGCAWPLRLPSSPMP
jgi:4-amino-4-deoxy-L-arabinose transferase-like glycosyltransferase